LEIFELKGRVISNQQLPVANLQVEAFDDDPILDPDDLLGEKITDSNGYFTIQFDKSKFNDIWELLDGTPDVYLAIKDDSNKEILKTKQTKTKKEIEYHIRLDNSTPNPVAIDPYSGNARRLLSMLTEVGELIGIENRINVDLLNKGSHSKDTEKKIRNFVESYADRQHNFDHFLAVLSSLIDSFAEELRIGIIGHDGPQVPRLPRRELYDQIIVWPRQEVFRWG
jgi:hypothetical protein